MANKPTKAELKEARKTEWQEKAAKLERDAKVKRYGTWGAIAAGFLIFVGLLVWLVSSPSSTNSNITISPVSASDVSEGPTNSNTVVIEYGDFQCPSCKAAHDQILKALIPTYKDRVRFIWRYFPLTSIHQNAMVSALAAQSANLQGKFWEMDDTLFDNQADWATLSDSDARNKFIEYAGKLGLDTNKFKADMSSDAVKKFVSDEQNEGLNAGVNATPTFFVNGKQVSPTSYDDFKKLLDNSLKSTK